MKGRSKPFDQDNHDANDPKAREVVKAFWKEAFDITLNDNPDRYGVDLISAGGVFKVEVEHRAVWKADDFPYAEVNVPERKAKFFVEDDTAYAVVSNDFTRVGFVHSRRLRGFLVSERLKESPNKFVYHGELFFKVPKAIFAWHRCR